MATTKLGDVYPIIIDKYESFVPLNGGVDMIEKINSVVEHLNRLGQLTTETVNQWNKVMKWVNADGLTDSVNAKIDDLIAKGLFDELLNGMMDDLNTANSDFQTSINNQETAFQNTINGQVNTLTTQMADITTKVKPKEINLSNYTFNSSVDATPIISDLIRNKGYSTILLPSEIWLNTPLNLTDLEGVSLIGTSRYEIQKGYSTTVHLNTGGVGIDITGSQNMLFRDMNLMSRDETNYSKIGILEGRSTTNLYAQFNRFDNIKMNLKHDMTANGGLGTIGIYNFKSELNTYNNIFIQADKPIVLTISNLFNITSPFVTQAGEVSMKSTAFTGITTLVARYGNALILDGACDVVVDHLYTQNFKSDTDNTEQFAIWATAPSIANYQVNNIEIGNFDNEVFQSFMKVQCSLTNSRFHGQHSQGVGDVIRIVANDANHQCGLTHSEIAINKATAASSTEYLIYAETGSNGFHGCLIRMANSMYGLHADVLTYGNIILASSSNGRPVVEFVAGSKYTLLGSAGMLFSGRLLGHNFGVPTSGTYNAIDIVYNTNLSDGNPLGYVCTGTGTFGSGTNPVFKPFGQVGYRFTTGTPTFAPTFVGEEVLDGNTKIWYKAVGTGTTDWKTLT